jgi:hypothetical protein
MGLTRSYRHLARQRREGAQYATAPLQIAAPGSTESWSQRALSLWQRKEIQALLRQPAASGTLIRVRNSPLRR